MHLFFSYCFAAPAFSAVFSVTAAKNLVCTFIVVYQVLKRRKGDFLAACSVDVMGLE